MHEIPFNRHSTALEFIQFTDSHLLDGTDELLHGVNTRETLDAAINDVLRRYDNIDFVLFTGDISQTGSRQSYNHFRVVIDKLSVPAYAVPGNHDDPVILQEILPLVPNTTMQVVGLGNVSMILLNSHVAGQHGGRVSDIQLQQLEDYLAQSDALINIIALHHPPVEVGSPWLDALGLQNRGDLMRILRRHPHKILLLSGHVHQEVDMRVDQAQLLATPSTCYQFRAGSVEAQREELPKPAYRYLRLDTQQGIHTRLHYLDWPAQQDEGRDQVQNLPA